MKREKMLDYEAVNESVLSRVPPTAQRVLDVGCGTGNFGRLLKQRAQCEVLGVTYSESEARIAAGVLDRVIVADLDSFHTPAGLGKFDVIICSHVLEHLRRADALLRLLMRHLMEGGRVIVALPNVLHWRQRVRFLLGEFKYTQGGLMDETHLHFFDYESAQDLLSSNGYRVLERQVDGSLPMPFIRRVLPTTLSSTIDRAVTAVWPGLFGVQFVLVAEASDAAPDEDSALPDTPAP